MARSSGRVDAPSIAVKLSDAVYAHSQAGQQYRISASASGLFFEALGKGPQAVAEEIPKRQLEYFIGSGHLGQSFIWSQDGFLFQAPVSYYSNLGKWDISPGFENPKAAAVTRPVTATCLRCHASDLRPVTGTLNGFTKSPFLENGVSCERCHGPGKNHIINMSAGTAGEGTGIVNPTRLEPRRRDSICAQCHLAGEAMAERPGRNLTEFKPGDLLSDYAVAFVWAPRGQDLGVTSHYEKLWQSTCKKASGDRLWCGNCHDPHASPSGISRAEYFRQKCLSCHQSSPCTADVKLRQKQSDDCVGCHMPKSSPAGVAHGVMTDHSIPRKPQLRAGMESAGANQTLVPFWAEPAAERELGIAYATVNKPSPVSLGHAFDLLKEAEKGRPADPQVLLYLALLYDRAGSKDNARALYERLVKLPAAQEYPTLLITAEVNLGLILVSRGAYLEAIPLFEDAQKREPGNELAGVYLAAAYATAGNRVAAEKQVIKTLEYNPDSEMAQELLRKIRMRTDR